MNGGILNNIKNTLMPSANPCNARVVTENLYILPFSSYQCSGKRLSVVVRFSSNIALKDFTEFKFCNISDLYKLQISKNSFRLTPIIVFPFVIFCN